MQLIGQILPIFLLIGLGIASRRFGWLQDDAVDGLKQIVVRFVLPSILFLSFTDMELKPSFLSLVALVFLACVIAFAIGWQLIARAFPAARFLPFLMSGYEFSMLGISLFVGVYGPGALPTIAVIGLGHELFIWFVFFAFLMARRDGSAHPVALLGSFARNPVTGAILIGLACNFAGVKTATLAVIPGIDALVASLRFLAPMIVPLVLIVVGHGLRFAAEDGADIARVIGLRLMVQLPLAILASFGVLGWALGFEQRFQVALFTLMILPPPFIVPLFMPADPSLEGERRLIVQVLTVHTVVSLAVFTVIIAAFPRF